MAVYIITSKTRQYRNTKPPVGSQINWGHPLAQGISLCFLWNEIGGKIANNIASFNQGLLAGNYYKWYGIENTADNANLTVPVGNYGVCGDYTVAIKTIATNSGRYLFRFQLGSGNPIIDVGSGALRLGGTANKFTFCIRTSGGTTNAVTSNTDLVGRSTRDIWVATRSLNAGVAKIYLNSILDVTGAGWSTAVVDTREPGSEVIFYSGTGTYRGYHEWLMVWNRCLTPSEIRSLYEAPYQFIDAPDNRIINYIISGEAPSSVTATPTTVTASISVLTPTIVTTNPLITATPTTVVSSLSVLTPTVVTKISISVPSVIISTLSVLTPTVVISAAVSVSSIIQTSLAVLTPTIVIGTSVVASPSVVMSSLSVLTPIVLTKASVIPSSLISISLSAFTPTINTSARITASPTIVTTTLSIQTPTISVSTGGTIATPGMVTCSLQIMTPTISIPQFDSNAGEQWVVQSMIEKQLFRESEIENHYVRQSPLH